MFVYTVYNTIGIPVYTTDDEIEAEIYCSLEDGYYTCTRV